MPYGNNELVVPTLSAAQLFAPHRTWNTSSGSLGNSGCGNNSGGFICSQAGSTSGFVATGGVLTWSWTGVDVTGDVNVSHVGYKYGTGTLNGMIVSDSTFGGGGGGTSVPEPGVLQLLGAGRPTLFSMGESV